MLESLYTCIGMASIRVYLEYVYCYGYTCHGSICVFCRRMYKRALFVLCNVLENMEKEGFWDGGGAGRVRGVS
jgi:hypothetical protein